ncbi:protein of unknown function [Vibrio tapetis subsp. tapetis]|uniref:Uncharacterized protein n=1 Tax=Vibrio tapetis subsp. tapetis TaxID=1671868 RepID=A0A2N8ZFY0_9VIBR|nr:protein of unknown function [Vibrio tapetis subsp. tapetis]
MQQRDDEGKLIIFMVTDKNSVEVIKLTFSLPLLNKCNL